MPAKRFGRTLANLLSLPRRNRAKLHLIVGAGISNIARIRHPTQIINNPTNTACATCRHVDSRSYAEQRSIWSEFEYNRLYSRNVLPELSFFFLAELCKKGLVKSIITTNYDSILPTIFERDATVPSVVFNPVLSSSVTDAQADFRTNTKIRNGVIPIYFIHGHFEWARFNKCGCVVRLPNWAVGSNIWKVPSGWKASIFHDFGSGRSHFDTGYAQHFIDWNIGRSHFDAEIRAAQAQIRKAMRYDGVLLLLGFRGIHCPHLPSWHEEIAEDIARAAKKIPTFMIITKQQRDDSFRSDPHGPNSHEKRWLLEKLQRVARSRVDVVDNFDDWLINAFATSGLDPLTITREYQYRWQSSAIFLTPDEFEGS